MNDVEYDPCECCGKTDMETSHNLCGIGPLCPPCWRSKLEEVEDPGHKERHS